MSIYRQFTATEFLWISLLLLIAILLIFRTKKAGLKDLLKLWLPFLALGATCSGAFYHEDYCSGMYCGRRYGLPRQTFEMAHYTGKDQVEVVVISRVYWSHVFQNSFLFCLIFLLLRGLIIKSTRTTKRLKRP